MRNIVICREFDELLADGTTSGVRLFVLMHEVAHQLLFTWGYRSIYRRQLTADRLAATLMELMDRKESATAAAQWFASQALPIENPLDTVAFTMSPYRARKIAGWLESGEETDRGWTRRIILPRMQTPALESMADADELHLRTRERVEKELQIRAETGAH
jgi:hypothetical protein